MNEKNWIKFRIVAWSIVAILLSIVLVSSINEGKGNIFSSNIFTKGFTISDMKVVKEVKFDDIDHIKNIKIDLNASDLIITEHDENNIKVIVKSNKNLKNKKYINTETNSDTLNIEDINSKSSKNIFGIFNRYSLKVEIKIPKSYKDNIKVNSTVGDITFDSDLDINNLDINSKVGDIEGNKKINSKKVTINSKVGDIDFNYLYGKDVFIKGTTGDIDIDEFSGKGSIESQVGDIACGIENLNGDLSFKSKVGDVELYINRNLSFNFTGNKDIDTDLMFNNVSQSSKFFAGEYGENPVNKITINVKAGDISIND